MMMALGTMLVLGILAAELVYQTEVYNSTVFHVRDELRAKLLARSGLRLAQLQIHAANKARSKIKSLGGATGGAVSESLADQIWQTPLILPPPPIEGLGVAETQALEAFQKSLGIDGAVSVSITGESDRLNLNQLVWVSKEQSKAPNTGGNTGGASGGTRVDTNQQALTPEKRKEMLESTKANFVEVLQQILDQKRQEDDAFRERYATVTAETLLGHLIAWMDPETRQDGDNRAKEDYYARVEPSPYALKNAPLASESELHMVNGFDDELVKLFSEHFTVQQTGSLNVNKASPTLIRALIPELGPDEVQRIVEKRQDPLQGGEFTSADDFWKFLNTMGDFAEAKKRFTERGYKILEAETSFRVTISAKSGGATKTWMARIGPPPPEVAPSQPQDPNAQKPSTPSIDGNLEDQAKKAEEEKKKQSGKNDSTLPYIIYLKAD